MPSALPSTPPIARYDQRAAGDRSSAPAQLVRAERDADADLARAARHHERQQRVDADDRQQQRHAAHRGQRRRQCRSGTRAPSRPASSSVHEFVQAADRDRRWQRPRAAARTSVVGSPAVRIARIVQQLVMRPACRSRPPAPDRRRSTQDRGPRRRSRATAPRRSPSRVPSMRMRRPIGLRPPRNFCTNGSLTIVTGAAPSRKSLGVNRRPATARAPIDSRKPVPTATVGASRGAIVGSSPIGSTIVGRGGGYILGNSSAAQAATTPDRACSAVRI